MKNVMKIVMGAVAFVCVYGANGARREMPRSDSGDTLEASLGMEHRLHKVIDQVERGEKPFEALECRAKKEIEDFRAMSQVGWDRLERVARFLVDVNAPKEILEDIRKVNKDCIFEAMERNGQLTSELLDFVRRHVSSPETEVQQVEEQSQQLGVLVREMSFQQGMVGEMSSSFTRNISVVERIVRRSEIN